MSFSNEIIFSKHITDDILKLRLHAPEVAETAKPGQFVHVRIMPGYQPFLRRPFSLNRVDPMHGNIDLLYRVVGDGTKILSQLKAGDVVDVMGPLGKGFDTQSDFDHAIIVAGGMGSAPVFFLIDVLISMGKNVTLLWGVRDGREIFDERDLQEAGVDLRIATEDASKGYCGYVTKLLIDYLAKKASDKRYQGFVCGPECMIKEVQRIVQSDGLYWQVSMEEKMACAVGVCLGCALSIRDKGFRMVCKDGPVFNLKEILLND